MTRSRATRPSRLYGSFGRDGEIFRRRPKPAPKEKARDPRRIVAGRIRLVWAVLAGLTALVVMRAWQLQIVAGGRYDDASRRQALTSAHITAKRGVIKDRGGAELAISVDVDSIYAEPRRIEDVPGTARLLAPILGTTAKKLEGRLAQKRGFVYLKRRVSPEIAAKVRGLAVAGIATRAEPRRFYANRELGAHVLGFIDSEGVGRTGIERAFDEALRGKSYEVPGLRDALGNKAFVEGFVPQAVLEGDDVILTIDRHIQHAAELELERAVTESGGSAGVALVLRPSTGEVLGLASYPTFNPNNLRGSRPTEQLNRALSAVYEPGSTLKMVTIAAAVEEGLLTPADRLDCENGRWSVGGHTIGDAQHKYGVLTVPEVMKHSSNICAAKIGLLLGRERLHRWLVAFGFGRATGIELPGELPGLMREPKTWRDIELANIAFGQGIAATPLQIAQAATVLANGGLWVEPHLLLATVDKAGHERRFEPKPAVRVVSPRTATRLTKMMIDVTEKGGTAEAASIPGFKVAGKTGTAQKIDPVTKAYSRSLYVASFVGFVPAERPEVLVMVLVDEPSRVIYGGQAAAPAFRKIAMAALSALSVFPEDESAREAFLATYRQSVVPSANESSEVDEIQIDKDLSSRAQAVLGLGSDAAPSGPGEPAMPFETTLSPAEADLTNPARGESAPGRMPNFAGLQVHEVINRSAEVHCDLVLSGTGRVVRQTPPAGAAIEAGERCELELRPRG